MWAYLRALLYTMFCDGLRDALFPFFAARDPARRDLGVACPDGGTMRLHFFEPAIARGPLVLLLHGLSGHGADAYAMELARTLRAAGVECVSSTRRGHGGLRFTSAAVSHAAAERDVALLVDALAAAPGQRGRPIVLLGVSFGGLLALRYVTALRAHCERGDVAGAFTLCAIVSPTRNCAYVARRSGALGRFVDRRVCARLLAAFESSRYAAFARGGGGFERPTTVRARERAFARRASAPEPVPLRAGARVRRARRVPGARLRRRRRVLRRSRSPSGPSGMKLRPSCPLRYYSAADVDLARAPPCVPVRMVAARDDIVVDPASLPTPAAAARLELELTERGAHCGDPRGVGYQLAVALRGGRGNYHVRALLRFLEDLGLRPRSA